MLRLTALVAALAAVLNPVVVAAPSQAYTWNNVKIGGGGGFVPGIVFNTKEKGLAYARTDIGGAYKLQSGDTWKPLLDFVGHDDWNRWGVDALATDPVQPSKLYLAVGMYTNSWDPNNGAILISNNYGETFTSSPLPFKVGGNMPGRGMGERLAVDPNLNSILFFGARSGNGLWKSTNSGVTWTKVSTLPDAGTYIPDPSDPNGYNTDKVGVAWVTFDSTSGSSGSATPRIFVGVASVGSNNIFVSENGGTSWTAIAGQNTQFMSHKAVLSPSEKILYISYSNGAGPYDGTSGAVQKYNIATKVWTNITPVTGSDLYHGFGGVAVDLLKPGTIMVAALNSWWPDGRIFRSTNGGTTWSPIWSFNTAGGLDKYYKPDTSLAPWIGPSNVITELGVLQVGWMMEALVIDPFDSNHWLYGTGATIYGGRDLLQWDTTHNVTIKSLADGIEETAILGLISPPSGPPLLSAVGDIGGFRHDSLTTAPSTGFINPKWASTADIDFAGNKPATVVRIGTGDSSSGKQVAISTNAGSTWAQHYGVADNVNGGRIAVSADGDTILIRTNSNGIQVSKNQATFAAVSSLPAGAAIASDKKNNTLFYGASGSSFYVSTNGGTSFTARGTLGSSASPARIIANPGVVGDVWVSTDTGLYRSTNTGTSFTGVAGVTQAWAIAFGAPKATGGYPAVFAAARIDGVVGYYRTDDAGVNWVKINDAAHGFGSAGGNVIAGDPRKYGRVYIGTNGRGIFYGDTAGSAPEPTATITSISTTATSSSSTTTRSSTTTSAPTTSAPSPTNTAVSTPYGQCGGSGYTGPTLCPAGFKCTFGNDFYSQCTPA